MEGNMSDDDIFAVSLTPRSWEELLADMRAQVLPEMKWLPPFRADRHYVKKLEKVIRKTQGGAEKINHLHILPYAILLGDVLVKRFQARWEYPAWPKGLIGLEVFDLAVRIDEKGDADPWKFLPVMRVAKFIDNNKWTLTSVYDICEALTRGKITYDEMKKSHQTGDIINITSESAARVHFNKEDQ
jgi:hypothetical protein